MTKILNVGVERDHVESITRSNGINALSEVIWNALDADAKHIIITYKKTSLEKYENIIIEDDGHGLNYHKAIEIFSRIGGSEKKNSSLSPGGRAFHGKEGKGRYKTLSLGDLVIFESYYKENGKTKKISLKLDRNDLTNSEIEEPILSKHRNQSGFKVTIFNVNDKAANHAFATENWSSYEEKFASYWISYPDFNVVINGRKLEFENLIKDTYQESFELEIGKETYKFVIKIFEWNFEAKKKTYLCNEQGIPFKEVNLGFRSTLPVSMFIQSEYIENLHRSNKLNLSELDENLNAIYKDAKKIGRSYVRKRLHEYSKEFINQLKEEGIYPYKEDAKNSIEVAERQVFDIVALQINEYLPSFNEQEKSGKKLTLALIKEALENDSDNLHKILSEVVELPKEKKEELAEILNKTSLINVIDTIKEISNRLTFLNGLEQIIYDKDTSKNVKERKHLHKIIINETWVFGEEYTYGVDDVTLKNVLKEYLLQLGRENFEEIVESEDNSHLRRIPDVCLWQQYNMGKPGYNENLVIELKKPTKNAGLIELSQIQAYAASVINDRRFPKEKTKWNFLLVTKDIKPELEPSLNQENREYGHVTMSKNMNVFVLTWGDIINKAKTKYEYIKKKLNYEIESNEEGLEYLKKKYQEYLPEEF